MFFKLFENRITTLNEIKFSLETDSMFIIEELHLLNHFIFYLHFPYFFLNNE